MTEDRSPLASENAELSSQRLDRVVAHYVDLLNAGEKLDPVEIIATHPEDGEQILERLEIFAGLISDGSSPLGTLGDYTLRRQIGRGGMGIVYDAWQNSVERQVALKVLPGAVAADDRAFHRFMREAKTAARLNHPNVVSVYAMGVDDHTPYYAMEMVEGDTLSQIIRTIKEAEEGADTVFGDKDGAGYFEKIGKAFTDVADGLQHAHSKGVIHRDIKPSNLILDSEGRLRIFDFGLAHLEGQESLTINGDVVGTPLYMSPEQARRKKIEIDQRTDVYSLGATMYEALCGRPPFRGKDHQDTLSQIIEREPVEPKKMNPSVPKDLETIVLKCLRKDPGDRYGTAEALGQDLRRFVRGDPIEARPQSKSDKLVRCVRRHLGIIVTAGSVAVLLLVLGWVAWARHSAENARLRLEHDVIIRDVVKELYRGRLTLLGDSLDSFGSTLFIFKALKFKRGMPALEETVTQLNGAAEAVLERPEAHYYLSQIQRLAGSREAAIREAAQALERDPNFVPAEVVRQELIHGVFPLPDAVLEPILARYQEQHDGWQQPWILAYKHERDREWKQAALAYGRLVTFREEATREPYVGFTIEALMGRGRARLRSGDFDGAIFDFAAASGTWSGFPEPGLMLGLTCHMKGDSELAERFFLELYATSPGLQRNTIATWILGIYVRLGEHDKVAEWRDRVTGWERDRVDAMLLYGQNRYEECMAELYKVLDIEPHDLVALVGLAWARLALQWRRFGPDWDEERQDLLQLARKTSALYPSDPHAQCILATALHVNGFLDKAVRTARGAIALQLRRREQPVIGRSTLAGILRMQGDLMGAKAVFEDFPPKRRENRLLPYELVRVLEEEGRCEEAIDQYEARITRGSESALLYSRMAVLLNRLERYDEAVRYAKGAIERLPRNTAGYESMAYALWKLGRSEEALKAADEGAERLPGRQRPLLVRAWILEGMNKLEEAARSVSGALVSRPNDPEAGETLLRLLNRRESLASLNDVMEAEKVMEVQLRLGQSNPSTREILQLIRRSSAWRTTNHSGENK